MNFSFDSWPWKFALVLGLLAAREFVRLLSPKEDRATSGENGRWLIETIDSATIAIGLVLFVIQPFILQAFFIPSGSMENTLRIGDRLLVSKVVYRLREPQHHDVIVFHAPPQASPPAPDDDFIKRCIGLPGDRVSMDGRTLTINGKVQSEPYTYWDTEKNYGYDMRIIGGVVYSREHVTPRDAGQWTHTVPADADTNGEIVQSESRTNTAKTLYVKDPLQSQLATAKSEPIPPGKLLMMGDHRNNSSDGHVWGLLDKDRIVGKAVCVFWPGTRLGLVDRMSEPKPGSETGTNADADSSETPPTTFPTPPPNPAPNPGRFPVPGMITPRLTTPSKMASHLPMAASRTMKSAKSLPSQAPLRLPVRIMAQGARVAIRQDLSRTAY